MRDDDLEVFDFAHVEPTASDEATAIGEAKP